MSAARGKSERFRVAIDIGGAYEILPEQTITDSAVAQQALWTQATDPSNSAVVPGKIVGNGTFSSSVTYLAIGASVYFGGTDSRAD